MTRWIETPNARRIFFALAFAVAALYGALALKQAFSSEYIVQDDARQHVFWMQRFVEPGAFPNDLIADYFQFVAPYGYSALYRTAAKLGIEPVALSKVLPFFLGLAATFYFFRLSLLIYPSNLAALITTIMFNQGLWLRPNIVSGTPRAFAAVLLAVFVYYLARGSLRGCALQTALQGMFYPPVTLVSLGTAGLGILRWQNRLPRLSSCRQSYWILGGCLAVGVLVLLPYFLKTSQFGPTIDAREARVMPEFGPEGRSSVFVESPKKYWISGKRTGLLRRVDDNNPLIYATLALPFLWRRREHADAPNRWRFIARLFAVSVALWAAAHVLLFDLYLPARYMEHTLSIAVNLTGGIAAALMLERLLRQRSMLRWCGALAIAIVLFFWPAYKWADEDFPDANFVTGGNAALYEFLAAQPADTVIASLSGEADLIPTFAHRSVLVAREYAIPYQVGYYRQFSERVRDLIGAHYSPRLTDVQEFIQRYGVDFFVLDPGAFQPGYLRDNRWLQQYQPETGEALSSLERGLQPVLQKVSERCSAAEKGGLIVNADCIVQLNPQDLP